MSGCIAQHTLNESEHLRAEIERLRAALSFYADPSTYHAIAFLPDRPCGNFSEDFSEDPITRAQGYRRAMAGKFAREVLGLVNPKSEEQSVTESGNIVDRLRYNASCGIPDFTNSKLLDEAAAEIDKLRAEIKHGEAQAKIMLDSYADENQRFHDEIERLRAEVERLQQYKHAQAEDIMTLGQQVGKLEDENASLRAEVGRLRAENMSLREQLPYIAQHTLNESEHFRAEIERLRADNERLRDAGNVVFNAMCHYRDNPICIEEFQDAIDTLAMALDEQSGEQS